MRDRLAGIFPPVPTPFDRDGAIDPQALGTNIDRWMRSPLAGLLVLGSNGEAPLVDESESDTLVEAARAHVPPDRVLIVGVGRESTRHTAAACRRAAAGGADAVLVRTPSFFRPQMSAEALYRHFAAVADASPVPVLLYNLPGATGIVLTVPLVARLAEHTNIVGIKETSPELERLTGFAALPDFAVLSGWAPVVYPALLSGAVGAILAVANVIPDACVELVALTRSGRHDAALRAQRAITRLAQLVSTIHGIAGLKFALDRLGYYGGPVRPPLLAIDERAQDEIARALVPFGLGAGAATVQPA